MIEVKKNGDKVSVHFSIRPPTIYLDHWAIRELSSKPELKKRFELIFKSKGTILFSPVNSFEISRNIGESPQEIQNFLAIVGENWAPIENNPVTVIAREKKSPENGNASCLAENFFKAYYPYIHGNGPLTLSKVVELVKDYDFHKAAQALDGTVDFLNKARNHRFLSTNLRFDQTSPTSFTYHGLMKLVLKEKFNISVNDVADMWHATVALAYADIVLLDRRWQDFANKIKITQKRKIKVYSQPQLSEFLQYFENFDV